MLDKSIVLMYTIDNEGQPAAFALSTNRLVSSFLYLRENDDGKPRESRGRNPSLQRARAGIDRCAGGAVFDEALQFKPGKVSGSQALADCPMSMPGPSRTGWTTSWACWAGRMSTSVAGRCGGVPAAAGCAWARSGSPKWTWACPAQPDEGDRRKAAFSDALKRAAVKFGIGRYLYRVGPSWANFDPQKKRFVRPPTLPAEALTKRKPATGKVRAQAEIQEPRVAAAQVQRSRFCPRTDWSYSNG